MSKKTILSQIQDVVDDVLIDQSKVGSSYAQLSTATSRNRLLSIAAEISQSDNLATSSASCLVDSGATHVFVSQYFVERGVFQMEQSQELTVRVANGKSLVSNQVCNLILRFSGGSGQQVQQQVCGRVVDQLAYDLVLGIEWLQQAKPIVEWTSRVVKIQGVDIQACDCDSKVDVEVCSLRGLFHTARHTHNEIYICTLNGKSDLPAIHRECSVAQDGACAGACASDTSGAMKNASPDPCITALCTEFADVFADPGLPPVHDVTHDITLK